MKRITIPDGEHGSLQKLARLDQDSFDQLVESAKQIQPALPMRVFISQTLSEAGLGNSDGLHEMVGSLLALMNSISAIGSDVESVIEDLASQLRSADMLDEDELDTFRTRITRFLTIETFALVSQAFNSLVSSGAYYVRADILGRLAPLYIEKSPAAPEFRGAAIFHELSIRSTSSEDEDAVFRCLVDLEDLQEIRRLVDRAIAEDKLLRERGANFGLRIVDDASIRD
jgi:hypothetical protein